jgi:hypothetical protein
MRLAAIEDAEAVARNRLVELVRSHVELLHDLLHQTAPLTLHYVAATPLARGMQPRDADPMSTPRGFVKSQRDANGRTAAGFRASASNAHVAHYDEDDAQVRQAIEHELRGLRDLQQQLRHRDQMREACVETERLEWAEQRRVLEKRLAAAQKALAGEQRESAALRSQLRALCKSLRPPASYLQTRAYPHSSSQSDASDVDAL